MSGTEIQIKAADGGEFMGYLATPEGGSGPGIVVIQEIFGVNAGMRQMTDDLAAKGYLAKLLGNPRVTRYLNQNHQEILTEFQRIADVETPAPLCQRR